MLSLSLSEPYFSLIQSGLKTAEGRVYKNRFIKIKPGDIIEFKNDDKRFTVRVTTIDKFNSFYEMMENKMRDLLPNIINPDLTDDENYRNGVAVYREFFDEEQEKLGVISIGIDSNYS